MITGFGGVCEGGLKNLVEISRAHLFKFLFGFAALAVSATHPSTVVKDEVRFLGLEVEGEIQERNRVWRS